jgi:tRNA A-37 threonylcarbamoyl transferase component Bud32
VIPTPDDLRAYRQGRLDLARFEIVDRWLAGLPGEEQARLLEEPDGDGRLAGLAPPEPAAAAPAFMADPAQPRYRAHEQLGAGGMGIVEAAHDAVLGREVALKRCRPRRPEESLAAYAARVRAFKREAAVTAKLEHPGIVPVHDVGVGALGEPAFIMKRLDGEPLSALIARGREGGGRPDLARIAELILRVAEAIGYAHRCGIVHRDLKPDNVIVGALGAVSVIDWGLAAAIGPDAGQDAPPPARPAGGGDGAASGPTLLEHTTGTYRLGTPAWMAPEQFGAAPPDPRMDVFALGGLLMALLCGQGPRERAARERSPAPAADLAPLERRGLPRGLVAVARRCLASDPAQRYQDGSAVADELRRWLGAGVTQAERPTLATRALAKLRHSPRLAAALVGMVIAVAVTLTAVSALRARARLRAEERVLDIVRALDLGNENDVHAARAQVEFILHDHPGLGEAQRQLTGLRTAEDVFAARAVQRGRQERLRGLRAKYLQKGSWPGESDELLAAITDAGYLSKPVAVLVTDYEVEAKWLRIDPLRSEVLAALVQLERAYLVEDAQTPLRAVIPKLITAAGPTPGWRAIGQVLAKTSVAEHDLLFAHVPAADLALDEPETADLLLATYGPEPRLVKVARERWHEDANAFWPRVISARECIANGEWRQAERHALIALGKEPESLWPHLILAYVALADDDQQSLLREADAGLLQNPAHLELIVLKAVALARSGRLAAAQALIDGCGEAGHLQYHLRHRSEHPMERSVEALVAAGVTIPDAPAAKPR